MAVEALYNPSFVVCQLVGVELNPAVTMLTSNCDVMRFCGGDTRLVVASNWRQLIFLRHEDGCVQVAMRALHKASLLVRHLVAVEFNAAGTMLTCHLDVVRRDLLAGWTH
jgi:hypothetical protein